MRQLKITKQVTNRETASLDKYLQEIGRVDLITADEEVELAQRIKAGDVAALENLLRPDTTLVSVMAVNNEIGSIQPIEAISELLADKPTISFISSQTIYLFNFPF